MAEQRFTAEEFIHKAREADVLIGQGKTIGEGCKALGVKDKTYFRWRRPPSASSVSDSPTSRSRGVTRSCCTAAARTGTIA